MARPSWEPDTLEDAAHYIHRLDFVEKVADDNYTLCAPRGEKGERGREIFDVSHERMLEFVALKLKTKSEKLPRCEAYGGGGLSEVPYWTCGRIATRSGNCDPANSFCCDEHKCRCKCPDLPYAKLLRQAKFADMVEKIGPLTTSALASGEAPRSDTFYGQQLTMLRKQRVAKAAEAHAAALVSLGLDDASEEQTWQDALEHLRKQGKDPNQILAAAAKNLEDHKLPTTGFDQKAMDAAWQNALELIRERGDDPEQLIAQASKNLADWGRHWESMGRKVREVWIGWAKERPEPKASWLMPWEELSEPDKDVDRRIGRVLWELGFSAAHSRIERLEKDSASVTEEMYAGWKEIAGLKDRVAELENDSATETEAKNAAWKEIAELKTTINAVLQAADSAVLGHSPQLVRTLGLLRKVINE